MTPRRPGRTAWPVVVVFHGGGWETGSRKEMRERVCRRYLAQGFLVVNADYRLGLREASDDAERVLAWSFRELSALGGDTRRVVVTGESSGAHLALLAAFRSTRRVAAVVNFYGVADLSPFQNTAAVQKTASEKPGEDVVRRFSPLYYIGSSTPPVISVHGTEDSKVPLEQTELLGRKLQGAGIPTREVLIEQGGHGFSEHQLNTAYREVFEFLRGMGIIP